MKSVNKLKTDQFEVQRAVKFLLDSCLDKKGKQKIINNKPVVTHSLRVAFDLLRRGYDKNIVISAILHDLNEDADVSIKEIEKNFGKKIARIVEAFSYDKKIKNNKKRYFDLYCRTEKAGREVIIISIADHLDNTDYYNFIKKSNKEKKEIYKKWQMFLKEIAIKAEKEPIYKELKKK